MSKTARIKEMGAKTSTPMRQSEEERAAMSQTLQDAALTEEHVKKLKAIDNRMTSTNLKQWVQSWAIMREEVSKMNDLTDEIVHETLGSAQLFASEINGWVVTALMLELVFAEPPRYVIAPDAMRETKPKDVSTFTMLEGLNVATIKVDRENWFEKHETVSIDKRKTLQVLDVMKSIKYFEVVMKDLQRAIYSMKSVHAPTNIYWPDKSWITKQITSAWSVEPKMKITCNVSTMTVLPVMGKTVSPKHVAAVIIPTFPYAIVHCIYIHTTKVTRKRMFRGF